MFEISISKLLVVAVIIALLFGTRKLRSLGSDLGEAIKGFKKALHDDNNDKKTSQQSETFSESPSQNTTISNSPDTSNDSANKKITSEDE